MGFQNRFYPFDLLLYLPLHIYVLYEVNQVLIRRLKR